MEQFGRETLISISRSYLTEKLQGVAQPYSDIDVRLVRYYEHESILNKPVRVGRENRYTAWHVKQLVATRLLQTKGASLALIRSKIKNAEAVLEEYGAEHEIGVAALDLFIAEKLEGSTEETPTEPDDPPPQQKTENQENLEMSIKTQQQTNKQKLGISPFSNVVQLSVHNYQDYSGIHNKMKLGSAFAFLLDLDEPVGKKLYKLIHGQKAKGKGCIKNAVIAADEDGFELPGCTAFGRDLDRDMAIIVTDKDIYKEGDDVVGLFIFDPAGAGQTKDLTVHLNYLVLDHMHVKLDANGCGFIRLAAAASGTYKVTLADSNVSKTFEVARYTLAPLTATLTNFRKSDDKLHATIEAVSFGQPFVGPARIEVLSGHTTIEILEAEFHEGMTSVSFSPRGDDSLSLRIFSRSDADLITSVPLPGTSKEQRQDDVISGLGRVRTVSLVPSPTSQSARGLAIMDGAITNTPIRLESAISDKVELSFVADADELTVIVREPVLGVTNIYEVGAVQKGKGYKIQFNSAIASVHIGAIIDGKPWEGHATVVRPSSSKVTITAPAKLKPGEKLNVRLQTKHKSTVLLRVADKRMRVQEGPITATASMLKRWITKSIGSLTTGEVLAAPPTNLDPSKQIELQSFAMRLDAAAERPRAYRSSGLIASSNMLYASNFADTHSLYADAAEKVQEAVFERQLRDAGGGVRHVTGPRGLSGPSGTRGTSGFSGFSGVSGFSGSSGSAGSKAVVAGKTVAARETEADLVYCSLVEVDHDKTVKIQLPDNIGEYDVTAFAVNKGDWTDATHDLSVDKDKYLEPLVPQFAHPDDGISAMAIAVRAQDVKNYRVRIDGKETSFTTTKTGPNIWLSWTAVPGLHEIAMLDDQKNELDKVVRVVEMPGEETVIGQELRILKNGDVYDLGDDNGGLTVKILPGIQSELKVAVAVCTDFSHSCCEQTSAKVVAACVAAMTTDDPVAKEQAFQSIIRGEARLKSMYIRGKGFTSYPGGSMNFGWSAAAARRISNLEMVMANNLPADAKRAIESMIEMGKDVLQAHGEVAFAGMGEMESIFYGRQRRSITAKEIDGVLASMTGSNVWNYIAKSEACFCAANLIRAKKLEEGIKVVNAVAKVMCGTMGGAMHGSYETLAYMHMIDELRKAGVIPGTGEGKVVVDGKEMAITKAMEKSDITKIKAVGSACAIRITRLSKIRFDDFKTGVKMTLDVTDKTGNRLLKAGAQIKLTVKLDENYRDGDVLCVALPDCLSRIIAGAKTKKFQIDFAGQREINVDLVAGSMTERPQRWAAVVRNMYDGERIGSVGLLTAEIKK